MSADDEKAIYTKRLNKLGAALGEAGLQALALNPGPSLTYFTGLQFLLGERPVVALFTPEATPALVLPQLEAGKLEELPYEVRPFTYGEDPDMWGAVFKDAMQAAGLSAGRIGVEPGVLRFLELSLLQAAAPQAQFVPADEAISALRLCKDADELAAMREAAGIAQRALEATLPLVKLGMSEQELANELVVQLLRAGSGPKLPFSPIVAAGPNSADPHAFPTTRPLASGELLLIDWGASYKGYFSDITRVFALGEVEAELVKIHQITAQANAAGRAAARPGVSCGEVDHAARQVIEKAGYGEYFTHRTGHGLGIEIHEPPFIRGGNPMLLQPGMTFTIEPGIYLPGRGGVRVEDDVVVTSDGLESLTDLSRELIQVG